MIEVIADEEKEESYCFECGDSSCMVYPIVYEDKDCYIVSRLCKYGGIVKMDYKYQKIIKKENVETYNIDNVYEYYKN